MRIELELTRAEACALLRSVELIYEDDPLFTCAFDAVTEVEVRLRKLLTAFVAAEAAKGAS